MSHSIIIVHSDLEHCRRWDEAVRRFAETHPDSLLDAKRYKGRISDRWLTLLEWSSKHAYEKFIASDIIRKDMLFDLSTLMEICEPIEAR